MKHVITSLKSIMLSSLLSITACTSQAGPRHFDNDSYSFNNPRFNQGGFQGHERYAHDYEQSRYDNARVLTAEPIFRSVQQQIPQQRCWTETVEQPAYRENSRGSMTSTIIGGLIGGAIGNAVGHNNTNKKVGAIAGAALGASVGNDISRSNRGGNTYSRDVRQEEYCNTQYDNRYTEEVVGYNVTYQYNGEIYHTQTQEHPGRHIRVAVDVRPY